MKNVRKSSGSGNDQTQGGAGAYDVTNSSRDARERGADGDRCHTNNPYGHQHIIHPAAHTYSDAELIFAGLNSLLAVGLYIIWEYYVLPAIQDIVWEQRKLMVKSL